MASYIRRRKFLATLLGGAAAWPLAARAQQGERVRRVGVLMAFAENDPDAQAYMTAFRQALEKLGWAAGRNVRIDYRWGGAEPERIRTYAIELVGLKPDVILAVTAQALQPLQQVTSSIPIVFTQMGDPIGLHRKLPPQIDLGRPRRQPEERLTTARAAPVVQLATETYPLDLRPSSMLEQTMNIHLPPEN